MPVDIIRLIEVLKNSPNVKICVSSRPWNEFESVFGRDESRKIYMETLTRLDIAAYVQDMFERDPAFREMKEDDEDTCVGIIKEIVDSAKGVFLWVRLVVNSLLEGITNADRMVDLRRRLDALPTDLEEYFRRIVFIVDTFYRQRTAHCFRVTIEATSTLPLMLYWFMDQEDPVNYALNLNTRPMTMQATNIRLKQTRKRLNACCRGLLEVQFFDTAEIAESSLCSSILFNLKVDFLHRTARDFLETEKMKKQLEEWAPAGSDIDLCIASAVLALVKSVPQESEYFKPDAGPVAKLQSLFISHWQRSNTRLETKNSDRSFQELKHALGMELEKVMGHQMMSCDLIDLGDMD
jgi:hypothetical protein